jgi:hypothetical protein
MPLLYFVKRSNKQKVSKCMTFMPKSASFPAAPKEKSVSSPLFRVHISSGSYFYPIPSLVPRSGKDTWQIVFIHEVFLPFDPSTPIRNGSDMFFLIFGKNELRSPTSLSPTTFPLAICIPMHRPGDAISVSFVIPLHVLLQVQFELTIGIRGA